MKSVSACLLGAYLAFATAAFAQAPEDVDLEQFRAAYISGTGLTYVVLANDKGERLYRYGDTSREAARRDRVGYMLFNVRPRTCSYDETRGRGLRWPKRAS
jgi:hypothetical protein